MTRIIILVYFLFEASTENEKNWTSIKFFFHPSAANGTVEFKIFPFSRTEL